MTFTGVVQQHEGGETGAAGITGFGQHILRQGNGTVICRETIQTGGLEKVVALVIQESRRNEAGGGDIAGSQDFNNLLTIDGQSQGLANPGVLPHVEIHVEVVVVGTQKREDVVLGVLGDEPGYLGGRHVVQKIKLAGQVSGIGGGLSVDEFDVDDIDLNVIDIPVVLVLLKSKAVTYDIVSHDEGAIADVDGGILGPGAFRTGFNGGLVDRVEVEEGHQGCVVLGGSFQTDLEGVIVKRFNAHVFQGTFALGGFLSTDNIGILPDPGILGRSGRIDGPLPGVYEVMSGQFGTV